MKSMLPFPPLKVVIRADASFAMGGGHVMRCLALAEALARTGATVSFICRNQPGHLAEEITRQGYPVQLLPEGLDGAAADAQATQARLAGSTTDWLVVDHYGLDRAWEQALRPRTRRILAIDDLADRPHDCDLLVDQNLYPGMESRYADLLPADCVQWLGPRHALLRAEFAAARARGAPRTGTLRSLLVCFGASDPAQQTAKALEAVKRLDRRSLAVDVAVGQLNPQRGAIEALARSIPGVTCHSEVRQISSLMESADLCVGAAGITALERCCLGLPSLVVTVAANQVQATRELARRGALRYLGHCDAVSAGDIQQAIADWAASPESLRECAERALALVDGLGAERCAQALAQSTLSSTS